MTRETLITISVILNIFYVCENIEDNEMNHKISFQKQCFHSSDELSDVIKTFNISRHISGKSLLDGGNSGKCGLFVYFPHFTFLFGDEKFSVSVYTKAQQDHRMKRSATEDLLVPPTTTR